MAWRTQARHRLHKPEAAVYHASYAEMVTLFRASGSARDRLIVLLI